MSLVAQAVRLCTVRALLGNTLAGTNVDDSPVDPIAVATSASTPYIAVFTDTEANRPDGDSTIEGFHVQELSIHVFLPAALKVEINGLSYDFQERESGAALVIDVIYRQIQQVLMAGEGVWSNLWRQFVCGIQQVDARAYVLTTPPPNPIRTPARQIVMRVDTVFDPPLGADPVFVWADFIAAVNAEPDLQGMGPLLTGLVRGDLLPQWRQDQAELGLSDDQVPGLGLGPDVGDLDPSTTEDVVPIMEVDIKRDDQDPLTITEDQP